MPVRKVSKQSTPEVVADAARILADKNSGRKAKELAGSIVSDQGKKKAPKKTK